ncbi:hypothetical protein CPB83DRAFT_837120 [Crepidotus variabilis]|uniref:Ubiquitin-like domain-containing protein n=1 Tax=Crepidotus variabilis TaxID=179855 RepID=A0A9P6JNM6_9AGAR|nr:hypothetical protein CPB83DRAFT_837120 [Crepidotus variabilis]
MPPLAPSRLRPSSGEPHIRKSRSAFTDTRTKLNVTRSLRSKWLDKIKQKRKVREAQNWGGDTTAKGHITPAVQSKIKFRSKSTSAKVGSHVQREESCEATSFCSWSSSPYCNFEGEFPDPMEDIVGWGLNSPGADEESFGRFMGQALPRGIVTIADQSTQILGSGPNGCDRQKFTIPIEFAMSYETFDRAVKLLFRGDTMEARLQQNYVEKGLYDFGIDEGRRVKILNETDNWSLIGPGTNITMRVIQAQQSMLDRHGQYQCPRPGILIPRSKGCAGRFQISGGGEDLSNVWDNYPFELVLLRNIHLKTYEAQDLDPKYFNQFFDFFSGAETIRLGVH